MVFHIDNFGARWFFISAAILKRFNRFEWFFSILGSYWIALSMIWVPVKEPNGKVVSRANKIMGPREHPLLYTNGRTQDFIHLTVKDNDHQN